MADRLPKTPDDLYSFASEVEQLAERIFANGIGPESQERLSPKVVGICLLARSLSNFRGGVVLLRHDRVVEARVLARCCFENLFATAALGRDSKDFISQLEAAHRSSQKLRGEFLLAHVQDGSEEEKRFKAWMKELNKLKLGMKIPTPKEIAKKSPIFKAYAYYLQLSHDAAHPTIKSLMGRYVGERSHRGKSIAVIDPNPTPTQDESQETLFYLCEALLGVCVWVGDILGGNEGVIQPALDQYKSFVAPT